MLKRMQDLTPEEKQRIYRETIRIFERDHKDISWSEIERRAQVFLDRAFDDKLFPQMSPDDQIDAAFCRKEFRKNKPSLVDYFIWTTKFVMHTDMIAVPNE